MRGIVHRTCCKDIRSLQNIRGTHLYKNRTSNPEEVYYKTCDMLFGLYRRHQDDYDCFNETCRLCLEYGIYTGKRFEAVLRNTLLLPSDVHTVDAPTPTNHENMRGASYFK